MGLNLSALSKLTSPTQVNQNASIAQPVQLPSKLQLESPVPDAPSKQNEVTTSLAKLESIASAKSGTAVQVDQSGGVSTDAKEVARTIKYQEVSDSISSLREAIHGAHPKMPGLLQEIWKTLQSYPEQVTLLAEDQMEIIISGLEKVVDTDLANLTIKAATSGKKGKSAITTASLGF